MFFIVLSSVTKDVCFIDVFHVDKDPDFTSEVQLSDLPIYLVDPISLSCEQGSRPFDVNPSVTNKDGPEGLLRLLNRLESPNTQNK